MRFLNMWPFFVYYVVLAGWVRLGNGISLLPVLVSPHLLQRSHIVVFSMLSNWQLWKKINNVKLFSVWLLIATLQSSQWKWKLSIFLRSIWELQAPKTKVMLIGEGWYFNRVTQIFYELQPGKGFTFEN